MSVWPKLPPVTPSLSTAEGALVSVSIHAEPHCLESLLEALAQVSFPINPQIYHDAHTAGAICGATSVVPASSDGPGRTQPGAAEARARGQAIPSELRSELEQPAISIDNACHALARAAISIDHATTHAAHRHHVRSDIGHLTIALGRPLVRRRSLPPTRRAQDPSWGRTARKGVLRLGTPAGRNGHTSLAQAKHAPSRCEPTCHCPPRGALIPRAFSASAICRTKCPAT